ncbi:hemagglutinin repeat-containing protein [Helicobacter cappadocius]|uniref:Hemagglutinin repeat-containing protein n=1 Tax=Helicobacter cappadocius TaxID=3063998 RepID=A0AA90T9V2_9HELI|nr:MULTISPECIES: hemagglutinin repeat-containing protein [unclassified Helicobacter]MDO7253328.1 hemagglutinin repeat-containing protein [Helicobacter sp. faydin-H75]MDP2539242.1 hemagglutinin repeat-containing protein [Helicobacter sp. faydin-H76]
MFFSHFIKQSISILITFSLLSSQTLLAIENIPTPNITNNPSNIQTPPNTPNANTAKNITPPIIIDTSITPNNPSLDKARNNIDIVNISTPNDAGISNNYFKEFNVSKSGLIFNNSKDLITSTELAGLINGNSHLKDKEASLILNQITGNHISELLGYMEIAGKSADLIIANPNGISCNGCGFINSSSATLTTGSISLEELNRLNDLRDLSKHLNMMVQRGHINIEALNASNIPTLNIIAQSLSVNKNLLTNKLNIILGNNKVGIDISKNASILLYEPVEIPIDSYNINDNDSNNQSNINDSNDSDNHLNSINDPNHTKEDKATSKTKTALALDVAYLGSILSRSIYLVATTEGIGVKNSGRIATIASEQEGDGGFVINVNGKVEIAKAKEAYEAYKQEQERIKELQASNDISNKNSNVSNNNSISSNNDDLNMRNSNSLNDNNHSNINDTNTNTANIFNINSNHTILDTPTDTFIPPSILASKDLSITAKELENHSIISSNGDLDIKAESVNNLGSLKLEKVIIKREHHNSWCADESKGTRDCGSDTNHTTYDYDKTITEDRLKANTYDPAIITAKNIHIKAENLTNDTAILSAEDKLSLEVTNIVNTQPIPKRVIKKVGVERHYDRHGGYCGGRMFGFGKHDWNCHSHTDTYDYTPSASISSISLDLPSIDTHSILSNSETINKQTLSLNPISYVIETNPLYITKDTFISTRTFQSYLYDSFIPSHPLADIRGMIDSINKNTQDSIKYQFSLNRNDLANLNSFNNPNNLTNSNIFSNSSNLNNFNKLSNLNNSNNALALNNKDDFNHTSYNNKNNENLYTDDSIISDQNNSNTLAYLDSNSNDSKDSSLNKTSNSKSSKTNSSSSDLSNTSKSKDDSNSSNSKSNSKTSLAGAITSGIYGKDISLISTHTKNSSNIKGNKVSINSKFLLNQNGTIVANNPSKSETNTPDNSLANVDSTAGNFLISGESFKSISSTIKAKNAYLNSDSTEITSGTNSIEFSYHKPISKVFALSGFKNSKPIYSSSNTSLDALSSIQSDNLYIKGEKIAIKGSDIATKNNLFIDAKNLDISAVKLSSSYSDKTQSHSNTTSLTSSLQAKNISINTTGDANLTSANLQAKNDITLNAKGNISFNTALNHSMDKTIIKDYSQGDMSKGDFTSITTATTTTHTSDTHLNNQLMAKNIHINSNSSIDAYNLSIKADDKVSMNAKDNITLSNLADNSSTDIQTHQETSGFKISSEGDSYSASFGKQTTHTHQNSQASIHKKENIQASSISISSGKDISIESSNLIARDGDISLDSLHNISISSLEDKHSFSKETKTTSNSFGISIPKSYVNEVANASAKSTMNSLGKGLQTLADKLDPSNSENKNSINHPGLLRNPGKWLEKRSDKIKSPYLSEIDHLEIGVGFGHKSNSSNTSSSNTQASSSNLSGNNILINAKNKADIIGSNLNTKDDINLTGKDVNIIAANNQSSKSISTSSDDFNTSLSIDVGKNTKAKADISYNHTQSKDSSCKITHTASNLSSKNLSINSSKNTLIKGSNINATQASIQSESLNVLASKDSFTSTSKDNSFSASMGGGFNLASLDLGINISSASGSKETTTYNNAALNINNLKLTTEKNLNIKGGNINTVNLQANIKGDMNIQSLQDTHTASQNNTHLGASINTSSLKNTKPSFGNSPMNSDTKNVKNQSGINAKNSLQINIANNTDLKGAYINTENNQKDKTLSFTLSTRTLSFSNITNSSNIKSFKGVKGYQKQNHTSKTLASISNNIDLEEKAKHKKDETSNIHRISPDNQTLKEVSLLQNEDKKEPSVFDAFVNISIKTQDIANKTFNQSFKQNMKDVYTFTKPLNDSLINIGVSNIATAGKHLIENKEHQAPKNIFKNAWENTKKESKDALGGFVDKVLWE